MIEPTQRDLLADVRFWLTGRRHQRTLMAITHTYGDKVNVQSAAGVMRLSIPDFQKVMLPLLAFASDQQDHNIHEAIDALAKSFDLSDDERKELLPSGRQAKFDNRIAWAVTHLAKAGLLVRPHRGYFQITPRGKDVLAANPAGINMSYLSQFPEYLAFKEGSTSHPTPNGDGPHPPDNPIQTPEEILELGYLSLRTKTSQELLDRAKACSPRFFEQLVVDLLVAMGYGGSRKDAGQAIGRSGDDGIDGIITGSSRKISLASM